MKLISSFKTSLISLFTILLISLYIENINTLAFIPIIISLTMTFYSIFDTIEDIIKNQLKK